MFIARMHTDILSKGAEHLKDLEALLHSDGDALVQMEKLEKKGEARDGQDGAREVMFTEKGVKAHPVKRKASSSNASEIRNPYVIKFSKRGVVNPDALQVQPTSPLCGKNYEFTLLDFAVVLGLYTEDEINEPSFRTYLEAGEMNFDKFPIRSFWESISKNDKGRKNDVSLRDPKLNLIHRLLVNAVLHCDYSQDKVFHTDEWLMSLIPTRRATNVPWIITTYLFNRAAKKRGTSNIGGGHWVTRIVKNLRLFVPLEIKRCSSPLKSRCLDKKAFAGLIDKETNALLLPDEDDEEDEDEDEQEIEHEENVEQEEQIKQEALVQQKDGFEVMSRWMSETYGMVSRLTYQMDYFEAILTHYAQVHNLTMIRPYNPLGVPGMRFPMYPPPSPPTNSNTGKVVQAGSSQNVGGVDTSIVGSMGHGNDDIVAGPSQVAKLVEYDDEMDEDGL
ncbi:hypothetical protein Tco_1121452 [Tanacetum coccineum]|uniref:Uncharacterized protein n=1 Tax=Tanacetum coccineum TaxID=301880 RepID=A0ABQ5IXQ7_9ASTR